MLRILQHICCMARSLRSLREVAILRHDNLTRRSASLLYLALGVCEHDLLNSFDEFAKHFHFGDMQPKCIKPSDHSIKTLCQVPIYLFDAGHCSKLVKPFFADVVEQRKSQKRND